MKTEKKFCWKVLAEDGLLKDHRPLGPYYNQYTFDDEFDTEQQAVETLEGWMNRHEYGFESKLVLITKYSKVYD